MDYPTNFITQEQIEKVIELPFIDIHELLSRYVYFKGLVWGRENEITYVDGYFIIETSEIDYYEFLQEEVERDYHLTDPDTSDTEMLVAIKGTEFSNYPDLIDEVVSLKGSKEIEVVLYSYKQLCELMLKLGCPQPLPLSELTKKEYRYDVSIVNQKSNFTLEEAAKLSANVNITGHTVQLPQTQSSTIHDVRHYLELLSDCIKGTNQHKFKLHTVELWCSNNDEFGESYSKRYENGTYLKQKANLDCQLTVISKQEFIRWCEYANVDTGLTFENRDISESIEALIEENQKLKTQLVPQVYKQPPSARNNKEIDELTVKVERLTEELNQLRKCSFPIKTSKLQAMLEAQNKYWLNSDQENLPSQQSISNYLAEKLGLNVTSKGTNRTADELAKAIQPSHIKRK